jgi:hypothetical protein
MAEHYPYYTYGWLQVQRARDCTAIGSRSHALEGGSSALAPAVRSARVLPGVRFPRRQAALEPEDFVLEAQRHLLSLMSFVFLGATDIVREPLNHQRQLMEFLPQIGDPLPQFLDVPAQVLDVGLILLACLWSEKATGRAHRQSVAASGYPAFNCASTARVSACRA